MMLGLDGTLTDAFERRPMIRASSSEDAVTDILERRGFCTEDENELTRMTGRREMARSIHKKLVQDITIEVVKQEIVKNLEHEVVKQISEV